MGTGVNDFVGVLVGTGVFVGVLVGLLRLSIVSMHEHGIFNSVNFKHISSLVGSLSNKHCKSIMILSKISSEHSDLNGRESDMILLLCFIIVP